ncbi:MAG: ABC transporter, partial [Oscillospiraceae bacterium]|nr:ABC transporter [Oscillospiraceae bacterium]
LSEVQAVCDRIVIINRGRIAADDTAENLSRSITNDHKLVARIDGPRDEVVKLIRTINGVVKVVADMERENGVYDYEIEAMEGTDIRRELFKRLSSRNWPLLGLKSTELTLEDIFLKITMGEGIEIKSQKPNEEAAPTEEPAKDETNGDENKDANGNDGGAN